MFFARLLRSHEQQCQVASSFCEGKPRRQAEYIGLKYGYDARRAEAATARVLQLFDPPAKRALRPQLLRHRDMMYKRHLELLLKL